MVAPFFCCIPSNASIPVDIIFGNYIPDGTDSPFAASTAHASWQMSPAPRPITRTRIHPCCRSVSPMENRKPALVRPNAMATDLRRGNVESRKYFAMEHAGGKADMRCGRGVNGRPPTAACKGACVYKNAKPSESHILFALAGIFVHVCRRCQRADRAGGFHVGLIFCNFSIKRKVKDYNFLID